MCPSLLSVAVINAVAKAVYRLASLELLSCFSYAVQAHLPTVDGATDLNLQSRTHSTDMPIGQSRGGVPQQSFLIPRCVRPTVEDITLTAHLKFLGRTKLGNLR